MYIRKSIFFYCLLLSIAFSACNKTPTKTLAYDLDNSTLPLSSDYIIACAAGMPEGFMGETNFPVSMFFYPVVGATNFKYYETTSEQIDPFNYSLYLPVEATPELVFNGYLQRFPIAHKKNNRWGIVTYEVNGEIRICDPIYIKVATQPTILAPNSITIQDNGIMPNFNWNPLPNHENKIHFNVVANKNNDLITGTYTYNTDWQFYDLSSVVLNITDQSTPPILMSNTEYLFTLMSVSDDNWVNLFGQKDFITE